MSENDDEKTEYRQEYEWDEKIEDSPEFKDFEERILKAPALRAFHEDEGAEKPEEPPNESFLSFLLSDGPDASRIRRKALRLILRFGLALLDDGADDPDPHDDPDIN